MTDVNNNPNNTVIERKTYTVPEIAVILGVGKNQAYDLCKSNQFKIIKVGRTVKVVRQSFESWLNGGESKIK